MAHLVDIFLQPGKVFEDLRERPRFALPLALLLALSAALPLWYFLTVDTAWYMQHMLLASGREFSAAELEKTKEMMQSSLHTMPYFGAASAAIVGAVVFCLYALYFMLAGKVTGAAMTFRRGMALTTWSTMPSLLGLLVALVGVATMQPHTPLESLMLTNVDPLLVQLPADSPWLGLARAFSLLNFWSWFLMALGWRIFNRASWRQSIIVAVLPSLVVYGVMVAIAMAK